MIEKIEKNNSDRDPILLDKTKLKPPGQYEKLNEQKIDGENRKILYTIHIYEDQIFFLCKFFATIVFIVFIVYCISLVFFEFKFDLKYKQLCSQFEQSWRVGIFSNNKISSKTLSANVMDRNIYLSKQNDNNDNNDNDENGENGEVGAN